MRENLFRGQAAIAKKWIEGSLLTDEKGRCYIGEYIPLKKSMQITSGRAAGKTLNRFIGIGLVMVDENTVGQYTGLPDKNGKKIFEGDIVAHFINWLGKRVNGVVRYDSKIASWVCCFAYEDKKESAFLADWVYGNACEIVGNIYDNPELITEV